MLSGHRSFIYLVFFIALLCLVGISCRKNESPKSGIIRSGKAIEELFFATGSQDARVNAIKDKVYSLEQAKPFIADYVRWAGLPHWDKALTLDDRAQRPSGTARVLLRDSGCQVVFIPFTKDSSLGISAFLLAMITPRDTILKTIYHWQYAQLPFRSASVSGPTAEDLALFFMGFEYRAFGHASFTLRDSLLFKDQYPSAPWKRLRISSFSPSARNGFSMVVCASIWVVNHNGQLVGCPVDAPDCNGGHWEEECWPIDFSGDYDDDGGDGFPGTGGPGPGGTGGGWNDNPCRNIAAAGGNNPCDGNGGTGAGWEPDVHPAFTLAGVIDSLTNPCLVTARDKITDTQLHTFLTNLYSSTFTTQAVNIVFKEDTTLKDAADQPVESFSIPRVDTQSWCILLNTKFFDGRLLDSVSQEYTSLVILHEIVHSFIYIYRDDLGIGAVTQFASHKQIFVNWIEHIRDALHAAYPNLSAQDATALALSGIDDILRPEYDAQNNVIAYDALMNTLAQQQYGIDLLTAGAVSYAYRHGMKGTKCN